MPIYDIFETKEDEKIKTEEKSWNLKDRFFSSLTARLLFLVLLLGDLLWAVYSLAVMVMVGSFSLIVGGKAPFLHRLYKKNWLNLKRASVCGISLLVALFSPAFGIMIACTYFMMYDKNGIQEVVPKSLQDQFQDFLR
jgi:hypothetical protein